MFDFFLSLAATTPKSLNQSQRSEIISEVIFAQALPSAEMQYQEGLAFHQAGQLPEAVAAYQRAIELDATYDAAYINLSLIFIAVDDFENAKPLLEKVLELPDRPEFPASIQAIAHYNLGIIAYRQGDKPEALTQTQTALAIAPNFEQAQTFLAQLEMEP